MGTPPITPARPNWWSRNWKWFVPVGCLTLIVIFVAFIGGIIYIAAGAMKSSDAYKLALAKAQSNPLVQQKLGTPIAAGMFVSGSVNVAGTSGKADITIPISGPKGKGTIYVDATKFAGEWKFNRLEVGIDGETERIDLLQPLVKDQ